MSTFAFNGRRAPFSPINAKTPDANHNIERLLVSLCLTAQAAIVKGLVSHGRIIP